ncbi:tRNA lysidine(34) synthetase TilS [Parasediminibacterium paludis]|uniref:tRNA(Ile)-lysidine synthase n=1 Tax=Parasediminibacterium paludis TaxID=908966 RepID=A0ABV8PXG0_9BACT
MLLEKFKKYIDDNFHLLPTQHHVLLAVSGGIDSVVMVDLFEKAGFNFTIAHCNFQLRGAESDRDEIFVRQLGVTYNKEVLVKQFDTATYAANNKLSIQVAARELRYGWFKELVTSYRLQVTSNQQPVTSNFVATAHHADDNIETLLMHFFRGCGISGLHGILPKQGHIIRPLLFAKRAELVAHASEQGLTWVEDSSNATDKYSRNYIRHQIMPLMQTIYPKVADNLLGNIERFKEVEMVYIQSINNTKSKLLEIKGNEIHIPILKLKKQQPLRSIVYEIVKDFGFEATQVEEVIKLLDASNGSYMASATHRLIINRNWLIIAPKQAEEATNVLIEVGTKEVVFSAGKLVFNQSTVDGQQSADKAIATIDADAITYPLLLRPYKTGDYFYPLGMTKKKKLSKFFIDLKLSKTDKEHIWVIESDKRIVWVIGHRIDNRFKLKPSTKHLLTISLV